MKKLFISTAIISSVFASSGASWGYQGDIGPDHWGDIAPKYEMCKKGKNQSPINISNTIKASLTPLNIYYSVTSKDVINNGHTIKVNMNQGGKLYIDGKEFSLLQFHFHTPSENMIDGKYYPMEAHFVHSNSNGELAVVAVMFKIGQKENSVIKEIIKSMPLHSGSKNSLDIKANDLLPSGLSYYRFNGSLTTPPCTEGVRWFVLKKPVEVTKEQVRIFERVMGKNNRPIQDINSRMILE